MQGIPEIHMFADLDAEGKRGLFSQTSQWQPAGFLRLPQHQHPVLFKNKCLAGGFKCAKCSVWDNFGWGQDWYGFFSALCSGHLLLWSHIQCVESSVPCQRFLCFWNVTAYCPYRHNFNITMPTFSLFTFIWCLKLYITRSMNFLLFLKVWKVKRWVELIINPLCLPLFVLMAFSL